MKKNNHQGMFIVFEGLDGSGQSTQVDRLEKYLKKEGYKVLKTKEPTLKSKAGKEIEKILAKRKKVTSEELQRLFVEDRKNHLEKEIIPSLKRGEVVISDRYFFSTFAYGSSAGLSLDWLIEINNDFLMPDTVFFLNTKPKTCVERIEKRGDPVTLFEKEEKLKKVYINYKKIFFRFKNIETIEGEERIDEISFKIKNKVFNFLKK